MSERTEPRTCYLSVYSVDRAYGGPEEGGWYYSTYELVAAIPFKGTALIRKVEIDSDDLYGGGHDYTMLSTEGETMFITRAEVQSFDSPLAVESERNRLTGMYADSRGRLRDYTIVEEVHMGELTRLTRRRYC